MEADYLYEKFDAQNKPGVKVSIERKITGESVVIKDSQEVVDLLSSLKGIEFAGEILSFKDFESKRKVLVRTKDEVLKEYFEKNHETERRSN